jgi:uncharacterized protein YcfJ
MLRNSLLLASAVALSLGAMAAAADSRRDLRDRDDVEYARVVDVDPVVRRVRVTTPRRECWDEVRYADRDEDRYRDRYEDSYVDRYEDRQRRRPDGSAVGGLIVGGVVGGVLGNAVGRGDGRGITTAAGALIGAAIGHEVGKRASDRGRDRGGYRDRGYGRGGAGRVVERCTIRDDERWEERIDGYDVTYEYGGRRYHTRLPYDPGERLPVDVRVRPA